MIKEEYLTPAEVANILLVTKQTVLRYIRSKRLVALRLGKGYRVSVPDFYDFVRAIKTR